VLAVVVDLDGVLRRWDPAVLAGAEAAFGLPAGAVGEVAFPPALLSAAVTGRISDAAWREQVVEQLAWRFGRAGAVGAVARWSVSAGEVDPEVLAVIRGLRARCRVGLLTNATTRLRGDLARLGLAGEVDEVFGTAELGVAKPDPAVFRLVCGRLGVRPGQCGFVDDTAGHVAAAEGGGPGGSPVCVPGRARRFPHRSRAVGSGASGVRPGCGAEPRGPVGPARQGRR